MNEYYRSPQVKLMSAIFGTILTDNDVYQSIGGVTLDKALEGAINSIGSGEAAWRSPTFIKQYKRVLTLRFGLEDGHSRTLEEVGKEFALSRERIRQLEAKALRLLRHPSRSRKLEAYVKEQVRAGWLQW